MHNSTVLHLRKCSALNPATGKLRLGRGHAEDFASRRALSGEKRGREAKGIGKSVALTRRQNGVIAGRGCREELEVGYEGVTTRRAPEVLRFANVFK